METKLSFLMGGERRSSTTSRPLKNAYVYFLKNTWGNEYSMSNLPKIIPRSPPKLQKKTEWSSSLIRIQKIVKAAAVMPEIGKTYTASFFCKKIIFFHTAGLDHEREVPGDGRADPQGQGHHGEGHGAAALRGHAWKKLAKVFLSINGHYCVYALVQYIMWDPGQVSAYKLETIIAFFSISTIYGTYIGRILVPIFALYILFFVMT